MAKKPVVAPVPQVDLSPWVCGNCYYFETQAPDHGGCYAVPPTVVLDTDGGMMCPRAIVLVDDKGCIYWKARHPVC